MEILKLIEESVIQGQDKRLKELINEALKTIPVGKIFHQGLIRGMDIVGRRFRDNEMWMPEVMISARAMNTALEILEPFLNQNPGLKIGKFVIGTVKGDIHDVGKNMVGMMMRGAGFQVIDLGIDVSPEKFAEAILKEKPQILGMSALLSTTLPGMKSTIESIERAGLRNRAKIMVGGAPVTQDFAGRIGADGYAEDSGQAVILAKSLIGISGGAGNGNHI